MMRLAPPSEDPSVVRPLLSPVAASLLTFLAAAIVLVLEIAAARLLAPYVGVTITNVQRNHRGDHRSTSAT